MTAQAVYIVQQFEKQGKKLVAGRQLPFKTRVDAIGRAGRDAARCAGVIAVQQTVDTESGEVLEEPVVIARHGELPAQFAED